MGPMGPFIMTGSILCRSVQGDEAYLLCDYVYIDCIMPRRQHFIGLVFILWLAFPQGSPRWSLSLRMSDNSAITCSGFLFVLSVVFIIVTHLPYVTEIHCVKRARRHLLPLLEQQQIRHMLIFFPVFMLPHTFVAGN